MRAASTMSMAAVPVVASQCGCWALILLTVATALSNNMPTLFFFLPFSPSLLPLSHDQTSRSGPLYEPRYFATPCFALTCLCNPVPHLIRDRAKLCWFTSGWNRCLSVLEELMRKDRMKDEACSQLLLLPGRVNEPSSRRWLRSREFLQQRLHRDPTCVFRCC